MADIKDKRLTAQRLRQLLIYNERTGKFVWLNPEGRRKHWLRGREAGYFASNGHRYIKIDGVHHRVEHLVCLYMRDDCARADVPPIRARKPRRKAGLAE